MITIRRIRPGEAALYRSIRLRALKEDSYAFCATYESAIQRTEESWTEQADRSAQGLEQGIFIAFDNDKPVGLSAVYKDKTNDKEAEVFQVWVSLEMRGTGLGKKIMDTVFDWSSDSGYERVVATITNTNKKALGFYENYGFEKRSEDDEETVMTKETRSNQSAHTTPASAPR